MPEVDEFKLTVLVHKCLHGTALPYLADELHQSSDFEGYFADTVLLCIVDISDCPPHISLDPRCKNFSGSRVWQALPQNLISNLSLPVFRSVARRLFIAHFTYLLIDYSSFHGRVSLERAAYFKNLHSSAAVATKFCPRMLTNLFLPLPVIYHFISFYG